MLALAAVLVLLQAADECLVNLNRLAFAAHRLRNVRLAHAFADTVRHEPCRPIRTKAKLPPKLMGGHALFAGAKQVRCQEPFMQRDMAAFVQGADCGRERLTAVLALVDARPRALAL